MRNLARIVRVSSEAERFSSFTLQHLIIAWHARPDGACFPPVKARTSTSNARHRRNATFAQSNAKFGWTPQHKHQGNGNGATAPTSHKDTRSRAETLTRARARRDRDPPRRLRRQPRPRAGSAPPRGSPGPTAPAPSPTPPTGNQVSSAQISCHGSGGDAVSASNAASGNGRRLGTGQRGAGSGARVLARRRIRAVASARGNEWEELEPRGDEVGTRKGREIQASTEQRG